MPSPELSTSTFTSDSANVVPALLRAGSQLGRIRLLVAAAFLLAGLLLRGSVMLRSEFWVDEAESSINGLTVLAHGYPVDHYMGLPLYENTLIEPWPGHPEYEFRDSSYRPHGLAVYHGWLPLYSIAAAQALFGLTPDPQPDVPQVRYLGRETLKRALVPRLPSLLFSAAFLVLVYRLAREAAGPPAAMAALAWAALSERAVLFGYPARYYSATLCVTAFAAWTLWRAARAGRWRDFALLGLAGGLLFHTHQLSAVVFAGVILCAGPALRRTEHWKSKIVAAAALACALTLPWAIATGFFSTAASVPKVVQLFDGADDWLRFVVQRPRSLLVFGAAVALLVLARTSWLQAVPRVAEPLRRIAPHAAILVAWIALSYLAIHLLVPAASFFPNRLTLMMQVPGILLVGGVLGVVAQALHARLAPLLAGALAVLVLIATDKLAAWNGLSPDQAAIGLPAAQVLSERTFTPDTRLYASPNDQLLYQYLHGLAVQSVAPIRRSFFETYPGPIVFLETRYAVTADVDERIREAARLAGESVTREAIVTWRRALWERHAAAELARRGLPAPPAPAVPDFLAPVQNHLREADAAYVAATRRRMPLFRDVDVSTPGDLWLSFAYRFVDYASRLGPHANIYPRLQRARVELRPDASVILFFCVPLPADDRRSDAASRPN